jgi:hypothetical protein
VIATRRALRSRALFAVAWVVATGCGGQEPALRLPTPAELEGIYGPSVEVELSGNVVDVRAVQPADQLRRGGSTWAKVGPYIYLFSPQTRDLFATYTGVAAVRVTTVDGRGRLVGRAILARGALNSVTWKKAINLAGRARLEGTERPSYILDLIEYGEETVEHEYGATYVREDR